ncbi:MAG: glycosyltransferase, partial [Anaerolineales bacterium]|nr:glycosyltransferase [Anaerolineales bacterium]
MPEKPEVTVIAPVYNEAQSLPVLYGRMKEVLEATGCTWELLLVDDGSTDGSTEAIRRLGQEDRRVRPVIFARNFGHQLAVTAGLDYA